MTDHNDKTSSPGDVVLSLRQLNKSYGSTQIVKNLSLDIRKREFVTLLGPSGCGKSTILRMVIGLEHCDAGEIIYENKVIDAPAKRAFVPTNKRMMGMVFQSYAIWPQMNVMENVAYPLKVRKEPKKEREEKVRQVLELLGLKGYEHRSASQLSGGQQQRVALARALVFNPSLLLLDEPFSNLDVKLREQLRIELRTLQSKLHTTILFVTHDQSEALSLSDRVVVMNGGNIDQIDSPIGVYDAPASPFVRDFVGSNILFKGQIESAENDEYVKCTFSGDEKQVLSGKSTLRSDSRLSPGTRCVISIRPEYLRIEPSTQQYECQPNELEAEIEQLFFVGDYFEAKVRLANKESILLRVDRFYDWEIGQTVILRLPKKHVLVWPE